MSVAEASRPSGVLAGVGWMVLTTLLFVGVTGMVRHVGTNLPSVESAFIRYAFGVVILLPVMGALIRRPPSRQSMKLYFVRGVLHGLAVILWFYAMARIPIAEVTAIGYISPISSPLAPRCILGSGCTSGAFSRLQPGCWAP